MNRLTCEFVEASEVFMDFKLAWDVFINSDPDCTWGDNNRSMVTPNVIIDALENSDDEQQPQVQKVVKILKSLPHDMYVDLEN
jgi:hypothetical protein